MTPLPVQPIIDLTSEPEEKYQPLLPSPTEVKLEEEEIVFEREEDKKEESSTGLFERPFNQGSLQKTDVQPYVSCTGRVIKPNTQYIPSMGAEKRYQETVNIAYEDTDDVNPVFNCGEHDFTCEERKEQVGTKSENNGDQERIMYDAGTAPVIGVVLQQMHINKGLKRFGERARTAGMKEMNQVHEREAVVPVNFESLNEEEKEKIIDSLLLIEEKRDGKIKGRIVA